MREMAFKVRAVERIGKHWAKNYSRTARSISEVDVRLIMAKANRLAVTACVAMCSD